MYNKFRYSFLDNDILYYAISMIRSFFCRTIAGHAELAFPQPSDWSFLIRYSYSRFSPKGPTGLSLARYVTSCPSQWRLYFLFRCAALIWFGTPILDSDPVLLFSVQPSNELLYRLDYTRLSTSGWSIHRSTVTPGRCPILVNRQEQSSPVLVFIKDYSKSSRPLLGHWISHWDSAGRSLLQYTKAPWFVMQ